MHRYNRDFIFGGQCKLVFIFYFILFFILSNSLLTNVNYKFVVNIIVLQLFNACFCFPIM